MVDVKNTRKSSHPAVRPDDQRLLKLANTVVTVDIRYTESVTLSSLVWLRSQRRSTAMRPSCPLRRNDRPVTLPMLYETVRKFSSPRDDEQRSSVLPPACHYAIRHAVSRRSHETQNIWIRHWTAPFSTSWRKPHRCHARCRLLPLLLLLRCWYFVLNAGLKYCIIPGLHKLKLSVFALL